MNELNKINMGLSISFCPHFSKYQALNFLHKPQKLGNLLSNYFRFPVSTAEQLVPLSTVQMKVSLQGDRATVSYNFSKTASYRPGAHSSMTLKTILQIDSMLLYVCSGNRSQMTSACGKNKKSGTRGESLSECVTDVCTTFWRLP